MNKLVRIAMICPECNCEQFYLDTELAITYQCVDCGFVGTNIDLFRGYVVIAEASNETL